MEDFIKIPRKQLSELRNSINELSVTLESLEVRGRLVAPKLSKSKKLELEMQELLENGYQRKKNKK